MIKISNIKMSLKDNDISLKDFIIKKIKLKYNDIKSIKILKESIDARNKSDIKLIYTLVIDFFDENKCINILKKSKLTYSIYKEKKYIYPEKGEEKINNRPIIIGTGPCGLFCGLILAQMGYKPILLERGKMVDERDKDIKKLWKDRILNEESNIQFGEGGAGTFSDGKLTTLIKDRFNRSKKVLEEFVLAGAKEEILYKNKPHIGTDILKEVVVNLRNEIINLGGEVRFSSKVTDLILDNSNIKGVIVNDDEKIVSDIVVLAIGHSARDTFQMLYNNKVHIKQKPFAIGARVEHKQSLINRAQYGELKSSKLKAADYKLSYHSDNGRSAFTFCMCPGGEVVLASSERDMIVTNGMSENSRDKVNSNSALLVNVNVDDFESNHPLAGVEFQRKWERKAFLAGGSNYNAPAQYLKDFLNGVDSIKGNNKNIEASIRPDITLTNLDKCLPKYVISTMREAIIDFDKKLKGFNNEDAILIGVETRSSSPIRIERDDDYISTSINGLYPAGEGAGYAGGIMSAAIDGIKIAEKIISKYMLSE